jgi:hypothetical protein
MPHLGVTVKYRIALALVAALVLAPAVWADNVTDGERQARTAALDAAGVAFRTALDGTDSQTYSDTPPASAQDVVAGTDELADALLKVIVRHSTNGQTARIEVALWSRDATAGTYKLMDVADVQTSTATNRAYGALVLPERSLYFRLDGADKYAVLVTDVSGSGTVNVAAHTVGDVSKAAE